MMPVHLSWIKKTLTILPLLIAYSSITSQKALANMETIKPNCSLTIDSTPLSVDEVLINFSLKNPYDKKMRLLKWYTPFEGFLSDLFIITHSTSGEQLDYQGPMVKRLQPQSDDYLSISANEVSSISLNLSLSYHLEPGNYLLRLKPHTFTFEDNNLSLFPFICDASSISFSIK